LDQKKKKKEKVEPVGDGTGDAELPPLKHVGK
jgi:hypothetical protein